MRFTLTSAAYLMFLWCAPGLAGPYDNLGAALRQQTMINDLRTKCRVPASFSDEKIKSTFLAEPEVHRTLIDAADALRVGQHTRYVQLIADIRCPIFN